MTLINININKYFHMIPLWKSLIKLPVELLVELPVVLGRRCLGPGHTAATAGALLKIIVPYFGSISSGGPRPARGPASVLNG